MRISPQPNRREPAAKATRSPLKELKRRRRSQLNGLRLPAFSVSPAPLAVPVAVRPEVIGKKADRFYPTHLALDQVRAAEGRAIARPSAFHGYRGVDR